MKITEEDRRLDLIIRLCRELAKQGLPVGISDARPSAVLRSGVPDAPLMVTVDNSGDFFEWSGGKGRHPVDDPTGAAARITQPVAARVPESDDAR